MSLWWVLRQLRHSYVYQTIHNTTHSKRDILLDYEVEADTLRNFTYTQDRAIGNFSNNDAIILSDKHQTFYRIFAANTYCYIEGTNITRTKVSVLNKRTKCHCRKRFYGKDCGIPEAVWFSTLEQIESKLVRRAVPRRVINGLPVLNETDLLEARLHELNDTVDVFVLGESTYSSHGDRKKLYILEQLKTGFLKEFHEKILHVSAHQFPEKGKLHTGFADSYLRVYLSVKGISRILNIRNDDLFILNDADEIPSKEVVKFLRLYDGYTEPIALSYKWTVYGFFWKQMSSKIVEKPTTVPAVATMGFVQQVLKNNTFLIRNSRALISSTHRAALIQYDKRYPGSLHKWTLGNTGHYAGWHCSWCYR